MSHHLKTSCFLFSCLRKMGKKFWSFPIHACNYDKNCKRIIIFLRFPILCWLNPVVNAIMIWICMPFLEIFFQFFVSCSYARKLFLLNKTLVYTCTSISQELSQANAFDIWYKSRIVTVCMWLLAFISRDFVTYYQDFLTMNSNWLLKMLKLLHAIIDSRCDVVNISNTLL